MYARLAGPTFHRPVVYGVRPQGEEVALLSREQLYPLTAAQVRQSMKRLRHGPGSPNDLRQALLDMQRRYEEGRESGRHHGPPLIAMRLYECFWDMRDDPGPGPPDRRQLLFEATAQEPAT